MIWRLCIRVHELEGGHEHGESTRVGGNGETPSLQVTVGVLLEQGGIAAQDWPDGGLDVLICLSTSLDTKERLPGHVRVTLTADSPEASCALARHACVRDVIAEVASSGHPAILSAFAELSPSKQRGLVVPLSLTAPPCEGVGGSRQAGAPSPCLLPVPHWGPLFDSDSDDSSLDDTGTRNHVWDCGCVMSLSLHALLGVPHGRREDVLELGCGLGLVGVAAALMGHRCVATDLGSALPSAQTTFRANTAAIDQCGGSWRVEVLDWSAPPPWVFDRTWRAVLGADLLFDSAKLITEPEIDSECEDEHACPTFHTELLRLLQRLKFEDMFLADRERRSSIKASFLARLNEFGLEACVADVVPGGGAAASLGLPPLTNATDVVIWRVRHVERCGFLWEMD